MQQQLTRQKSENKSKNKSSRVNLTRYVHQRTSISLQKKNNAAFISFPFCMPQIWLFIQTVTKKRKNNANENSEEAVEIASLVQVRFCSNSLFCWKQFDRNFVTVLCEDFMFLEKFSKLSPCSFILFPLFCDTVEKKTKHLCSLVSIYACNAFSEGIKKIKLLWQQRPTKNIEIRTRAEQVLAPDQLRKNMDWLVPNSTSGLFPPLPDWVSNSAKLALDVECHGNWPALMVLFNGEKFCCISFGQAAANAKKALAQVASWTFWEKVSLTKIMFGSGSDLATLRKKVNLVLQGVVDVQEKVQKVLQIERPSLVGACQEILSWNINKNRKWKNPWNRLPLDPKQIFYVARDVLATWFLEEQLVFL